MFASNTAAWSVGRRGEPPRNRITDGRVSALRASKVPKSVSAETSTRCSSDGACEDFVVCGGLKTILADMHGVMPRGA